MNLDSNRNQERKSSKSFDLSPLPLADRSNQILSTKKTYISIHPPTSQNLRSPSSTRRSASSSTSPAPLIGSTPRSQSGRAVSASGVQLPSADGSRLSNVNLITEEEDQVNQIKNDQISADNSIQVDKNAVKDSQDGRNSSLYSSRNSRNSSSSSVSNDYLETKKKAKNQTEFGVTDEKEVITPLDRGRSAGGLLTTSTIGNVSGRTTKSDAWNNSLVSTSSPSLSSHWPTSISTSIPSEEGRTISKARASESDNNKKLLTAKRKEDWIGKDSAQAMSSGGSDDLAAMTQRVNLSDDTKNLAPLSSHSNEESLEQYGAVKVPMSHFNLYQQQPYLPQPDVVYAQQHYQQHALGPSHPPPLLREGILPLAGPRDGINEQGNLPPQRDTRLSSISGPGPLDPLTLETHSSAPVAYTGPYGLTMPPLSLGQSQSSPQSPIYGSSGHHDQYSADSGMLMYPSHYHHSHHPHQVVPSMTGQHMTQIMTTTPRSVSSSTSASISPLQGSMVPSLASGGYMMQQLHRYGPQSPVLVAVSDGISTAHLNQRELSSGNSSIPSGIPSLPPQHHQHQPSYHHQSPYGMDQQSWSQSQSSILGSTFALPTSWSGQYEVRSPQMSSTSGVRSGHQRIVSNQHAHTINSTMGFMPGSMSPPSSVFRSPLGSGRMGMHSRSPSSFSQFSHPRSATSEIQRSPLLDEFRSKHNRGRQYDLGDIKGSLVEFSSDQYGSRFIQEKLDLADKEDTRMVFEELLPNMFQLMTDVFGNYVIQKLFEHGTDSMRSQLVDRMSNNVVMLSLGTYGCRVLQKALEYIGNEEQMRLVNELRLDILTCSRDQNANHVVQKTLERVKPTSQIDFIPTAFRHNVYILASHCYSCRVLQRIFEHCEESQRRPLLDELLQNAEKLMHDQFGNYVVQWILQYGSKDDKEVVIELAKGNVMKFSRHKFASNVMEQVIRAASQEERYLLIQEALVPIQDETSTELQPGAIFMMKDQYANYVLQRFLELSEGMQKMRLYSIVKPALQNLKRFSTGYAKHLAAIERLLESNISRSNVSTMTVDVATSSSSS